MPLPTGTLCRTLRVTTDDGVGLHVEDYGRDAAALTVVLAHGWTLDRRTWCHQTADLPSRAGVGVRVLAYDHRGHGRSDPATLERATIEQLADDLVAVIRQCAPDGPLVLAGHSIGGMAIMALADQYPSLFAERVAAVAFVSSGCGPLRPRTYGLPGVFGRIAERTDDVLFNRLARRSGERLVPTAVLRPGLSWLLFGRPTHRGGRREPLALTVDQFAAAPHATLAGFRSSLREHDRRSALRACAGIPVLVLCGTRDRICPLGWSRQIAAALPDAEFIAMDDAGHMLPLERPDAVTERLAGLVRRTFRAPLPSPPSSRP